MKIKATLKKILPIPCVNFGRAILNKYDPYRGHPLLYKFFKKNYGIEFWGNPTYFCDGLVSIHNCDFMKDPLFARSYQLAQETGSWKLGKVNATPIWRLYILCWAAQRAKDLEGDFVECGVNKGASSRAIIHYINFDKLQKSFFLLDTFNGFSQDHLLEAEKKSGTIFYDYYEECYDEVVAIFKPFSNVKLVRGTIPETLEQVPSKKIAYLHIDMNCVIPEIAAAEFFWNKLVSGAIVLLDDYGATNHFLQKNAFDEFAQRKGVAILSLPTGQGLIIKP